MKVNTNVDREPQTGAVPCPFCGHPIPVTADALLGGGALDCRSCGATLSVDRDRSADALDSLRQIQVPHDADTTAPASDRHGRRRRARKRRR